MHLTGWLTVHERASTTMKGITMSEMSLFGTEAVQSDFAELVKRQSLPGNEPEGFWGTLTFILITIAVDC